MFANMKKDVTDTSNLGLTVGHVYTGTGYVLKKKQLNPNERIGNKVLHTRPESKQSNLKNPI